VDVTDVPCPAVTCGVNGLNSCHFTVRWAGGMGMKLIKNGRLFKGEFDLETEACPTINGGGVTGVGHGQYWIEDDGMAKNRNDVGGARRLTVPSTEPSPTVMAGGIGSVNISQYHVDGRPAPYQEPSVDGAGKPPYRVPSMAEVKMIPWNGFTVASTFSGCGGSCLGYRMAGFRVLWANEFVPHACECYEANADPSCVLDRRSIFDVEPKDVLKACGLRKGQLDLFDGSPPCQAFSTAGKRHKGWGENKKYEGGHEQRNEELFPQWLRLLRGLMPKTFVAENVSGMAKGTCKGVFLETLAAMKACGYRASCKMLDAQWLGVPQRRQRLIFVGVRNDLEDASGSPLMPCHPKPLPYRYSVRDAIGGLVEAGFAAIEDNGKGFHGGDRTETPANVLRAGRMNMVIETIAGNDAFEPRRGGIDQPTPSTMAGGKHGGSGEVRVVGVNRSTQWKGGQDQTNPGRPSPTLGTSPSSGCGKGGGAGVELLRKCPATGSSVELHASRKDLAEGGEGYGQVAEPGPPSPILDACPQSTTYATERRRFTILEVMRLCAFPDDFAMAGSYAKRWERMGNSVPPLMMRAVAEAVRDGILRRMA